MENPSKVNVIGCPVCYVDAANFRLYLIDLFLDKLVVFSNSFSILGRLRVGGGIAPHILDRHLLVGLGLNFGILWLLEMNSVG